MFTCVQKPAQNSKQPEMNARWKMQVYIYNDCQHYTIEIKFVKPLLNSTKFYQIQHTLTFLLLLLCMAVLCRLFSLEVLLENGNFNFIAIACCRPGALSRSESKMRGKDVT